MSQTIAAPVVGQKPILTIERTTSGYQFFGDPEIVALIKSFLSGHKMDVTSPPGQATSLKPGTSSSPASPRANAQPAAVESRAATGVGEPTPVASNPPEVLRLTPTGIVKHPDRLVVTYLQNFGQKAYSRKITCWESNEEAWLAIEAAFDQKREIAVRVKKIGKYVNIIGIVR